MVLNGAMIGRPILCLLLLSWENNLDQGHGNISTHLQVFTTKSRMVMSRVLTVHFFLLSLLYAWGKQSDIDMVWHNFPPDRSLLTINHQDVPIHQMAPSVWPLCDTQTFFQFKIWYWWSTMSCCCLFEFCWGWYSTYAHSLAVIII